MTPFLASAPNNMSDHPQVSHLMDLAIASDRNETISGDGEEETPSIDLIAISDPDDITIDNSGLANQPRSRGKTYSKQEDLFVCKAWIKASCDSEKGADQTKENFESSIGKHYNDIKKNQERLEAQQHLSNQRIELGSGFVTVPFPLLYPEQTGSSINQRFKKSISPDVMKWISIIEVTNDGTPRKKSGEDYRTWMQRMLELFNAKEGRPFLFHHCWDFLKSEPKFSSWIIEQQSASKKRKIKARPVGTKKAKKIEEQKSLIKETMKELEIDMTGEDKSIGKAASSRKSEFSSALGDLSQTLKSLVEMGGQIMLSSFSNNNYESMDPATARAMQHLHLAQLEKQALDLEAENRVRCLAVATKTNVSTVQHEGCCDVDISELSSTSEEM